MRNDLSDIKSRRAELIAKIFLLKSDFRMTIEMYPTPLLDFFVTLKDKPNVKFAVEVKRTSNFKRSIEKQLVNLRAYRAARLIDIPILLFRIDEKHERGELDFLIAPSTKGKRLSLKEDFDFQELNQNNLKKEIEVIGRWYERWVDIKPKIMANKKDIDSGN